MTWRPRGGDQIRLDQIQYPSYWYSVHYVEKSASPFILTTPWKPSVLSCSVLFCTQTIARYLTNNVLPVLKDRHDEFLLHELVKRGENHKVRNVTWRSAVQLLDLWRLLHRHLILPLPLNCRGTAGHEQVAEEFLPVLRSILREVPLAAHPRGRRSKCTLHAVTHRPCLSTGPY